MMHQQNGQWSSPQVVSFMETYTYGSTVISPDGQRFYFDVLKPSDGNNGKPDHDIWFHKKIHLAGVMLSNRDFR